MLWCSNRNNPNPKIASGIQYFLKRYVSKKSQKAQIPLKWLIVWLTWTGTQGCYCLMGFLQCYHCEGGWTHSHTHKHPQHTHTHIRAAADLKAACLSDQKGGQLSFRGTQALLYVLWLELGRWPIFNGSQLLLTNTARAVLSPVLRGGEILHWGDFQDWAWGSPRRLCCLVTTRIGQSCLAVREKEHWERTGNGDDRCAGSVGTFVIHNHHMTSIYLDDIYRDTFQVLTKWEIDTKWTYVILSSNEMLHWSMYVAVTETYLL